ncbi:hypothetical protein [Bacillus cereus]
MKRSENIMNKRLRQIMIAGLFLMLLITARFGYMMFLYENSCE